MCVKNRLLKIEYFSKKNNNALQNKTKTTPNVIIISKETKQLGKLKETL